LLLDAVHDHWRVRRDGARVVGDEQGATVGGDLLQAFPLDAEQLAVERVVEPSGQLAKVLGAAPLVDVALARVVAGFGLGLARMLPTPTTIAITTASPRVTATVVSWRSLVRRSRKTGSDTSTTATTRNSRTVPPRLLKA